MSNPHMAGSGQLENRINYIHEAFLPSLDKILPLCCSYLGAEQGTSFLSSFTTQNAQTQNMVCAYFALVAADDGKASCIIKDLWTVIAFTASATASYCTMSEQQNGDHAQLILERQWELVVYGLHSAMLWPQCPSAWVSAILVTSCSSLLVSYLVCCCNSQLTDAIRAETTKIWSTRFYVWKMVRELKIVRMLAKALASLVVK